MSQHGDNPVNVVKRAIWYLFTPAKRVSTLTQYGSQGVHECIFGRITSIMTVKLHLGVKEGLYRRFHKTFLLLFVKIAKEMKLWVLLKEFMEQIVNLWFYGHLIYATTSNPNFFLAICIFGVD